LQMISGMGRGTLVNLCRPSHAAADVFVCRGFESIGRGSNDSNAGAEDKARMISEDAVFKATGHNSQQLEFAAWKYTDRKMQTLRWPREFERAGRHRILHPNSL
jgi:hypothetical protein